MAADLFWPFVRALVSNVNNRHNQQPAAPAQTQTPRAPDPPPPTPAPNAETSAVDDDKPVELPTETPPEDAFAPLPAAPSAGSSPVTAPADPIPARRAAAWKDLPAKDPWCPTELSIYDKLAVYKYRDDEAMRRDEANALWSGFGVTRRGRYHANNATHREDAMAFVAGDRFAVGVVSDGAGSSRFSRIGSYFACAYGTERLQATLTSLSDEFDEQSLASTLSTAVTEVVQEISDRLREFAATANAEPRDFHCTFLLTLAFKTQRTEMLAFTQVGDGVILVERSDGDIVHACEADSGAMSGEVSCFLPMSSAPGVAAHKLCFYRAESVRRVLMASDGIADPFYPTQKRARLIFDQLDRGVEAPADGFRQSPQAAVFGHENPQEMLFNWMGFEVRGENDDRTVVAIHRPSQS